MSLMAMARWAGLSSARPSSQPILLALGTARATCCRQLGNKVCVPNRPTVSCIFVLLCPSLLEQIGVGSHPLEDQVASFDSIDQKPVRLYVAISSTDEIAGQLVVPMDWVERLAGEKSSDKNLELLHILAAPDTPLRILLELPRVDRRVHQIPSL